MFKNEKKTSTANQSKDDFYKKKSGKLKSYSMCKGPKTTFPAAGHLKHPQDMINADTSKLISKVPTVTIDDFIAREDKLQEEEQSERMAARAEEERARQTGIFLNLAGFATLNRYLLTAQVSVSTMDLDR